MSPSPDRILTQRNVGAMAAVDTIPHLAVRVRSLLAHGRRITMTRRYTYVDQPPEVSAGLTLDGEPREWARDGGAGIEVRLRGRGLLAGFGLAAYPFEAATEKQAWARYHDKERKRRDLTHVEIVGGLPNDGPGRDDLLVISHWSGDGVCDERVIAFDYGTVHTALRDRAARHLYLTGNGNGNDQEHADFWDDGRISHELRERYRSQADALLAALHDERY